MANPGRVRALVTELERLAREYVEARDDYEAARQTFEVAKDRLVSVRKRAPEVLPNKEWYEWASGHPEVRLVGLEVGDAILDALQRRAYAASLDVINTWDKSPDERKKYSPTLAAYEIAEALDSQGFEWRTATPRREIHAALLNLKNVNKTSTDRYEHGDAADIYKTMLDAYGLAEEDGEVKLKPDEDEVPF